jgi:hypothetical protein
LERRAASRCSELVVYSAALGNNFAATTFADRDLAGTLTNKALWRTNGRNCYFRFVLITDKSTNQDNSGLLERLVRLDPTYLPYPAHEMRRNVKVFKMIGHKLFHWAKRTVWIDAKLRIGSIVRLSSFVFRRRRRLSSFVFVVVVFVVNWTDETPSKQRNSSSPPFSYIRSPQRHICHTGPTRILRLARRAARCLRLIHGVRG